MSVTRYRHRIFSLHGDTGNISADVTAGDTVISVEPAVIADPSIGVDATIVLSDGTNTSGVLTISATDSGAGTLTFTGPVGEAFAASAPTVVRRLPHWVYVEKDDDILLTVSPEDPSHPVQSGSASVAQIRESLVKEIVAGSGVTVDTTATTITVATAAQSVPWLFTHSEKSGVNGGDAIAGRQTRVLNRKRGNTGSDVQLGVGAAAPNQMCFQPGTYLVKASAPALRVGEHQACLVRVAPGKPKVLESGSSEYSSNLGSNSNPNNLTRRSTSRSVLNAYVEITDANTIIELQHHVLAKRPSYGLGYAVGATGLEEIYSEVTVWQLSKSA